MKSIIVRVDDDTHRAFKELAEHHPGGMNGLLVGHIETLCANEADRCIRHLDGSLCPVSAMIQAIASSVHAELAHQSAHPSDTHASPA